MLQLKKYELYDDAKDPKIDYNEAYMDEINYLAIKIKYLSVHLSNFTKKFHSISDILEDTE